MLSRTPMMEKLTSVLEPSRRSRMVCEVFCYLTCILVTMGQLGLIDFYYLHHTGEKYYYAWIGGDLLVLIVMIWLLIYAIRYNYRCWNQVRFELGY